MNVDRWATAGALCVAVFSCGLAIFLESQARGVREESEGTRMLLAEVQDTLNDMDSRLASLERDPEPPKGRIAPPGSTPERTSGSGLETLSARIAEMRADLGQTGSRAELGSLTSVASLIDTLRQRDTSGLARGLGNRARGRQVDPDEIAEKQEIVCDFDRSDRERVRALRALRSQSGNSNPYSPEVSECLVEWMRLTESPKVRADIIRNLHRGEVGELKQPILGYLRADPDADVREEAAETLEHCLDDPSVRVALGEAKEYDPDGTVRRRASRTLKKLQQ